MSDTSKNKGGRPRVDATPITVRVPPHLLAALDAWIIENQYLHPEKRLTRPEAIRLMMQDVLERQDFWKP